MKTFRLRQILIASIVLAGPVAIAQPPRFSTELFGQLRWRHIGPEGNRVSAVAGVPGDPLVYYAGSASGGIFKTDRCRCELGAHLRRPAGAFDRRHCRCPLRSQHRLGRDRRGVHPQPHLGRRGDFQVDGCRRDVGRMGLEKTGRIGRSSCIHPEPGRGARVRAGHAYGPQPERGVFRTTDGGSDLGARALRRREHGCSELAMDPSNPRMLFAGMWQIEIKTWGRESGGPGQRLFMSRTTVARPGPVCADAGCPRATWVRSSRDRAVESRTASTR